MLIKGCEDEVWASHACGSHAIILTFHLHFSDHYCKHTLIIINLSSKDQMLDRILKILLEDGPYDYSEHELGSNTSFVQGNYIPKVSPGAVGLVQILPAQRKDPRQASYWWKHSWGNNMSSFFCQVPVKTLVLLP